MAIIRECACRVRSWVDQPACRGTFDILWISLVTVGISTYTMLCLNIPVPKDSWPGFPLAYAAGQWSRAKHFVKAFHVSGYEDWHMRHAFFADMGGFIFYARDGDPFLLNATPLYWLVRHKYVEDPEITHKEVRNRCIGRAVQGLAITTLELNALTIVSWSLTPLDFVDENGPGYSVNIQPIPNDRFPTNPCGVQEYLLCLATLVFTAIHVAGWNLNFPSRTEQILWRTSSLLLLGITVAFWVLETIASWTRLGRWKTLYIYVFDKKKLGSHTRRMTQRQQTMAKRSMAELPQMWEFVAITPLAILYGVARLYLIFEAFAELRNVKGSAYVNVEWTNFVPHV
ncbi:hypothetical protein K458DRAFT_447503 [Lentithecium fluviatile CBS 122367]|uniref:Uncharacterized protein n=1 Tax=Lentithecium fluviatile CBS 122367 TaxID=1168545 RepID=A0A6G1IED8_9PLEO|nr:hypothetical protein K458DRAFT_447503 [Lentithecium fluviatile CBS 122367]